MTRFTPDRWLRRWAGGTLLAGGAPWRLSRVHDRVATVVDRAYQGAEVDHPADAAVVRSLVDRGVLHPCPAPRRGPHDVTVVVPAYGRPDALARCLRHLSTLDVIVVDDGTPEPHRLRAVVAAAGARYRRLPENRGPAAARNVGAAEVSTALVAFVDSDCQPEPGWLDRLVPHFDDPRVAAVAPRIVSGPGDRSALARYQQASPALDMGRFPALVRPGARLGFVPSATLVVRREVLRELGFDEQLRLGEDVDLVWRLADAGHHVRYEPRAAVLHDPRGSLAEWAGRLFEYGTSAVQLEARHPGRLAPLRTSPWNLAALALLASRRPIAAAAVSAVATGLLARRLGGQRAGDKRKAGPGQSGSRQGGSGRSGSGQGGPGQGGPGRSGSGQGGLGQGGLGQGGPGLGVDVAARVVAVGTAADALAVGHVLRREYWPLGLLAAIAAPRSRTARVAVGLMLAPVLAEWWRERPALNPVRYTALRLIGDAAYGTGVLASGLRARWLAPLLPRFGPPPPPQDPRDHGVAVGFQRRS